MAYLDIDDMRQHLDIESDDDDEALHDAIADAQSWIENYTHRKFEGSTATRYFDRGDLSPENNRLLEMDEDLISITTLTNGDSDATAIAATEYNLMPRNTTPKHGILMDSESAYYWEFDADCWVSVAGSWGYSATPPADVKRACKHLAAFFYRQKDSQIFDVTAIPEAGVITIPQGIPATVLRILGQYRKSI